MLVICSLEDLHVITSLRESENFRSRQSPRVFSKTLDQKRIKKNCLEKLR